MRKSSPILPTITARVEAHAGGEAQAVRALHVGHVTRNLITQTACRIARTLRMVFMRNRCTEQGHDAVAGVLIDRAFEAMHAFGQDREEAIENVMPLHGIELLGEFHRAFDIGEQQRDLLALAFKCGLRLQDLVGAVLRGVIAWRGTNVIQSVTRRRLGRVD